VVLLSRDEAYTARSLIIVAPVTTRIRHITSGVLLDTEDGLPQKCAVNLDTMTTVPKDCLQQRIAALSAKKIMELDTAIHFAFGME
jgi:mRNA interferase MazF